MNQNKVHSQGNIPFSWENQPGVSKTDPDVKSSSALIKQLPPPPSSGTTPKVLGHDIQVPLPPCPFQPQLRSSSSRKGVKGQDDHDPFLAAYKACTKSGKQGKSSSNRSGGGVRDQGKMGSLFSCKRSCGVREDNLVKLSHISSRAPRQRLHLDAE